MALKRVGVQVELRRASCPLEAGAVVVDSYRIRADDPEIRARWIAAVDDLERDLQVDLLIDPAPGADPSRSPSARAVISGARFALVGPGLPIRTSDPHRDIRSILVTLGGSSRAAGAAEIATALARDLPAVNVRLVVGPWSNDAPEGIEVVRTVEGLGPHLAASDLVVTAAGVTMVESLALGRPTVAVIIADNQRRAAAGAEVAGAVEVAELDAAAAVALALARDAPRRRRLAEAAVALIDGLGPDRVAREIVARCR